MDIAFDPVKVAINREKHGVSLAFGAKVLADPVALMLASHRSEDGEDRWKAVGLVDDRLWTAVHIGRGDTIRFISVGKSNDAEVRGYHRNPR